MKIDQLLYFLETARSQHIGRAAKILGVSAGAISHSIAALEEELGRALFEKVGKRIYLTDRGRELAHKIEPILAQLNQVKSDLQSEDIEPEGHFKLAATHGLSDKFVTRSLSALQKRHPKLKFEIYSLRSAQVVDEASSGRFDLGICYSPTPSPKIVIQKIAEEPLVVAVAPTHPILKVSPKLRAKSLSEYPVASPKAFQGIEECENHPVFKELGVALHTDFIFDSYDVAVQKIRSSLNWGLLPARFVESGRLRAVPVSGMEVSARICAIVPKGRALPRFLSDWVKSLQE